tara:strand:+ start:836 stop:1576 length:741 start_codon:yes stop_codon:yes gene_type:complete
MTLPKVEVPTYELTLPSQDIKVKYRPFLVKEEKILLIAAETGGQKELVQAIKDIVDACTYNKIDASKLPIFDLEYLFLQIRAKSVGEIAKIKVLCPDDNETYADVTVDLSKVEVQVDDSHNNKIMIDEQKNLGIIFKYPTIDSISLKAGEDVKANTETLFSVLVGCIDHIFEGEKIYHSTDSSLEELKEFLENLSQSNFEKLKQFFETIPKLTHELEIENPKTKVKSKVTLSGVQDFFGSASPITA